MCSVSVSTCPLAKASAAWRPFHCLVCQQKHSCLGLDGSARRTSSLSHIKAPTEDFFKKLLKSSWAYNLRFNPKVFSACSNSFCCFGSLEQQPWICSGVTHSLEIIPAIQLNLNTRPVIENISVYVWNWRRFEWRGGNSCRIHSFYFTSRCASYSTCFTRSHA